MSIITVVGAGMMGSAMSFPARDNGHEVRLVGIHNRENIESIRNCGYHLTLKRQLPDGVKAYHLDGLAEAMEGADVILCGVSSFGIEWFEENIVPLVPEGTPVLSITKGLEKDAEGNLQPFPTGIIRRAAEKGQHICFNAVGGPVTSYELADRQQTHICFCGEDLEVLKKLKAIFSTDYYHISLTTDVAGLETAVAMKNAYALGVSLAVGINNIQYGKDGMQHYNPQAALFEQGVREAGKIISFMGGKPETAMFFAGDLYVTIFGGRTRLLGTLLGEGKTFAEAKEMLSGITLESVAIATRVAEAVRQLEAKGILNGEEFPLLMHVDDIISHGASLDIPWKKFETVIEG
ncbi:MAG: glycerol-3-phosphate dehydrogenase [Oscillospiraceae bacterium]|nr:glycerol-3-phosphate dehydrogenase [Oscillospiraceae bacterium]